MPLTSLGLTSKPPPEHIFRRRRDATRRDEEKCAISGAAVDMGNVLPGPCPVGVVRLQPAGSLYWPWMLIRELIVAMRPPSPSRLSRHHGTRCFTIGTAVLPGRKISAAGNRIVFLPLDLT